MESLRNALQHPWVFHSGYNIVNAAERRKSNTECGDCLLKYIHKRPEICQPPFLHLLAPHPLYVKFSIPLSSLRSWISPETDQKERRKRGERDQKERKDWDRVKIQPFSWVFGGWVGRFVVFSAFGRLWARERVEGAAIPLGRVFVAGEWLWCKIKCVKIAGNKFDYGDCGRKRPLQIYPILEVIPQKFRKFVA